MGTSDDSGGLSNTLLQRAFGATLMAALLISAQSQSSPADSADLETPVDCRIRLLGLPAASGESPGVSFASIQCQGPGTPITITANPAVLAAVQRGSVAGADLIEGRPDGPYLTFRFQNGVTIRDSEVDDLSGGGRAPIVFTRSTVQLLDSNFDRNSMAQSAVVHAMQSIVTVRNCRFRSNSGRRSGVISAAGGTSLTIRDSTFLANRGGGGGMDALTSGAVRSSGTGAVRIENTTFRGNFALGEGASAVLVSKTMSANFSRVSFLMNSAENGPALYIDRGDQSAVVGCSFRDNNGGMGNGGLLFRDAPRPTIEGSEFFDNIGETAALTTLSSGVEVSASVFRQNRARGLGGAVATFGTPVDGAPHSFARCIFQDNGAMVGGAIAQEMAANTVLDGCVFFRNNASALGGAVYQWRSSSTEINRCDFLNNTARLAGGAVSQATCAQWVPGLDDETLLQGCGAEEEASCKDVEIRDSIFTRDFANVKGSELFQRGCSDVNLTSNRFEFTPFYAVEGLLYQQQCGILTMEDNDFKATDVVFEENRRGKGVIVRKSCPL